MKEYIEIAVIIYLLCICISATRSIIVYGLDSVPTPFGLIRMLWQGKVGDK